MEDTQKLVRKSGRTLVIKSDNENLLNSYSLEGLKTTTQTNNGSYFLVFDTVENSNNAFNKLKNDNVKVRFAYYRLFFKMSGVEDNSNYNDIKKLHINWIIKNSDANVLYYKQYRKAGKFLGCGDFTIDTKESMDKLLDKEGLKNYIIDQYSGTFYRYNKKNDQDQPIHNEVSQF
jgi:hypothetical protein